MLRQKSYHCVCYKIVRLIREKESARFEIWSQRFCFVTQKLAIFIGVTLLFHKITVMENYKIS